MKYFDKILILPVGSLAPGGGAGGWTNVGGLLDIGGLDFGGLLFSFKEIIHLF